MKLSFKTRQLKNIRSLTESENIIKIQRTKNMRRTRTRNIQWNNDKKKNVNSRKTGKQQNVLY